MNYFYVINIEYFNSKKNTSRIHYNVIVPSISEELAIEKCLFLTQRRHEDNYKVFHVRKVDSNIGEFRKYRCSECGGLSDYCVIEDDMDIMGYGTAWLEYHCLNCNPDVPACKNMRWYHKLINDYNIRINEL